MTWQPSLVVAWFQFALGTTAILGVAVLALRWIAQPAERERLIQFMLAAVLALPLLSALAPFSLWSLKFISHRTITNSLSRDAFHDTPVVAATALRPDSSADVDNHAVQGAEQPDAASRSFAPRDSQASRTEPQDKLPASALSPPSAAGWSFPTIDAWLVLALAIILAHVVAALYFVAQATIGKIRLRQLCRAASDAAESVQLAWQAIAGDRAGSVRLLISAQVEAPLVFGWLRPVVVIPCEIADRGDAALNFCLAHEWSHIERADILSWHFVNLCQFVLWYQPAFWTLRRELRICQEFLADNRSAPGAANSLEYSELLLGLAKRSRTRGVVGALTMFDQPSQLSRRIKMLLQDHAPLRVRCRRTFTCCVLAISALLATTIGALRVDAIQADVETTKSAPSANAKVAEPEQDETPVAHMISHTQIMTIAGQKEPIKTKDFIAPDGRKRTEMSGHTTIFDSTGQIRVSLIELTKTAMVYEAKKRNHEINTRKTFLGWLQGLKDLRDQSDRQLGQKESDGKQATGFVATQSGRIYTMWFDSASGDPVSIEYDTSVDAAAAHILMTDFRFHEKMDESLFSFAVPQGYKVWQPPVKTRAADGDDKFQAEPSPGLEPAWSRRGKWVAVAGDPKTPILYALRGGEQLNRLSIMNESSEEISTTKIDDNASFVRAASLVRDQKCDLLTFSHWGPTVKAHRTDGKLLWYTAEASVNDVCAADLNNDGLDEVLVGYNGDLGLQALDSSGQALWKYATINVDHIAAGNIEGDERPEIVVTSGGKVHIFDAEGQHVREMKPGLYASTVRIWEVPNKNPSAARIVVAGTDASEMTSVAALDSQGKVQWSLERPRRLVKVAICRDQPPWLALTFDDGRVRVIDVIAGKEIAHASDQGARADVAWLPAKDGAPLLVVATGEALHAYRMPAARP